VENSSSAAERMASRLSPLRALRAALAGSWAARADCTARLRRFSLFVAGLRDLAGGRNIAAP
jgi:hypothetical protein